MNLTSYLQEVLLSWEHGLGRSDLLHNTFPFLSMNQGDANDPMAQEQHFPEPHLIQQGTAGSVEESTENMKPCTPSLRMNSPAIGFSPSQPTTSSLQSRATRQISLLLAGGWGVQGEEDVPDTEPVAVLP